MNYKSGQIKLPEFGATYQVQAFDFNGEFHASHDGLEILLASPHGASRQTDLIFRGKAHALIPGTGLIYNAQELHTEVIHQGQQNYYALVLSSERLAGFLGSMEIAKNLALKQSLLSHSQYSLGLELTYWLRHRHLDPVSMAGAVEGYLTDLFLGLEALPPFKIEALKATRLARQASQMILNLHCDPDFSLETMETKLGVTRFHLIRCFRQIYGITPHKLLTNLRLGQAKNLLMATNKKIIDVALASGFDDLSAFNKAFQRIYRVSPKTFRRQLTQFQAEP